MLLHKNKTVRILKLSVLQCHHRLLRLSCCVFDADSDKLFTLVHCKDSLAACSLQLHAHGHFDKSCHAYFKSM